jgi:hypothetical protein
MKTKFIPGRLYHPKDEEEFMILVLRVECQYDDGSTEVDVICCTSDATIERGVALTNLIWVEVV